MKQPRTPLTPALLGQFGKLGIKTASGTPLPEPPALLSTHELKERGWSDTMIAKLLKQPDATRANQLGVGYTRKLLEAPVKLYALARIEEAETTEEFLITQATANKGKAAAKKGATTRAAKLQAYLDGYVPQLSDPPQPLFGHALWKHHLEELTTYEHVHTDAWLALGGSLRRQASTELYTKHRTAFLARFGEDY